MVPGVVEDVLFGDLTAFPYAAALPLQAVPFQNAVFSRLVETGNAGSFG
jgi:hypothetical protein